MDPALHERVAHVVGPIAGTHRVSGGDFADAFAIVCHRHGIYVPHDYEVDVATAPPGAFS